MTNLVKHSLLYANARAGLIALTLLTGNNTTTFGLTEGEGNENTGALTIKIEASSSEGAVMLAVYGDAQSYTDGQPITGRRVTLNGTTTSVTINDLPYGRYAIKAFHDLDGDGKLTSNPFGAPIEPFAFSNSAKAHYGPPGFDAAAITISSPETLDTLSFLP